MVQVVVCTALFLVGPVLNGSSSCMYRLFLVGPVLNGSIRIIAWYEKNSNKSVQSNIFQESFEGPQWTDLESGTPDRTLSTPFDIFLSLHAPSDLDPYVMI